MRLVIGLAAVFAVFQWSASLLGSDRGQAGALVAAIVLAALLIIERLLFGRSIPESIRSLGLTRPDVRGLGLAIGVAMALLLTVPVFVAVTGDRAAFVEGWPRLVPGLFAQAGIAEEALFRGYLFGHLRRDRSFWRAAALSMPPFVAVHLWLFATMDWPVALAAVALAVVISLPLARLFDLGGSTIWAPAIVHAVVQGTVKVVEVGDQPQFALWWMAACAALPLVVLVVPIGWGSGPTEVARAFSESPAESSARYRTERQDASDRAIDRPTRATS